MLICLLAGGHVLLEGVPGLGKTTLLANARAGAAPALFAHSVHARPHARRHRRQHDHRNRRARRQGAALPAGSDLRQPRAGRRDQPRHAQDAIRAARSDAGAHRHQRHHHPRTRSALPRDGHAESHRDGGHLSAARSAARPLPDEDRGQLSEPRRDAHHRRAHHPEGGCARWSRWSTATQILEVRAVCRERAGGLACAGFCGRPGDGHAARTVRRRTSSPRSTFATAARRAARRRWWSAGACSR